MEKATELVDMPKLEVAAYQPFYADLVKLEEDNKKVVFNYESPKGNKEARSHVYKLRQTKGALEKTRKEAKADYIRLGKLVDSEASAIEERIEAMIAIHQVKIDEIEEREKTRVRGIQERIAHLSSIGDPLVCSGDIQASINTLQKISIDDSWQEFTSDAAKAKDARLAMLNVAHSERVKTEAEQAELARLRAEAEARAQADRDAAIAAAAVEQARKAAEEKAAEEKRKADQAVADAEAKAKAEREAAERRELELKLAAENAERRRVEQEQKAAQDLKDAQERAEKARLQAIEDEKKRAEIEKQAAEAAAAKREANKAHAKKINGAALSALVAGGISEDDAKKVITMIAKGEVPNVSIEY